ncbi:hypothetical protein HH215_11155 [Cohnella herbarum]|uniref:Uncharacterized protein n=2 Tax=Cohnella herbarum TaxID=2728023 RepID=A0A7Z2VII6_9BACL|nr:hypothetical protein HH215_11155 [Cohnella herbarum]
MQRHIDGDLDQQETSLMMDHAGQCPDCAAMLTRLQKLSSELEQLPRVVPKYSLVDAILPELERLHTADKLNHSNVSGENAANVDSNPVPVRSNRPARHLFRKISGVVAAGVVVGLLLFSNPGQWTLGGSGSHNDAAAPELMSAAEGADSVQKRSMGITAEEVPQQKMADQYGEPAANSASEAGESGGGADKQDLGDTKGFALGGDNLEDPESVGPLRSAYGLPATVDSPDGKWKAVAMENAGTFQILNNEDGSSYYDSKAKEGTISLLSWNDESNVLYFTVTDDGGTQTQWQFDIATSEESQR